MPAIKHLSPVTAALHIPRADKRKGEIAYTSTQFHNTNCVSVLLSFLWDVGRLAMRGCAEVLLPYRISFPDIADI